MTSQMGPPWQYRAASALPYIEGRWCATEISTTVKMTVCGSVDTLELTEKHGVYP